MSQKLVSNPLSRVAGVMAIMVFIITVILLTSDMVGVNLPPIIGILSYTLFPALLLFYLLLIPVGMYREWRRRHRKEGLPPPTFPRLDFNVKSQRVQLYIFVLGTSLVGLLVLAVSTKLYDYSESVEFCSDTCHKVMEPEATTYKNSPHARVECMTCHVGEGATWYVKSKLSGLYQVYATIFNKYHRPIMTPISNLRPSRDTCEKCHWPEKFYGARQVMKNYYKEDERNTPQRTLMLMNIGGGVSPTGIHWHVGKDEVYYIAKDRSRQEIPYIKVKYKDGREAVFTDLQNPPTQEMIAKGELRRMDCLDCHNRPTHIFRSPKEAMDASLDEGIIDISIPYIKKVGVEVLSGELKDIRPKVESFYKDKEPKAKIDGVVAELEAIWNANNFPHMRSKWDVYPDNIGHFKWPGCFRCHDGLHKDEKGASIKKDCNICHIFLSEEVTGVIAEKERLGVVFVHPADVGGADKETNCNGCHGGK